MHWLTRALKMTARSHLLLLATLASLPAWGAELLNTTYTFAATDDSQLGRLSRAGTPSKWSAPRTDPGGINLTTGYRVKEFNMSPGAAQYVQISFDDPKGLFFVSAYIDGYLSTQFPAPGAYLGDAGYSGNPAGNPGFFQVFVPYNHTLIVVVNEIAANTAVGQSFNLLVEGFGDTQFGPPYIAGPDLTVSISHQSPFLAGYGGFNYSLTVSNQGTGPSAGTIQLTDTLPASMTATAMSGNGWTCTLSTLTCTTSAILPIAATANPITLTVSISADSPSPVINSAKVSGGGDLVTTNNSSGDSTTISPARPPVRPHLPPSQTQRE